MTVKDRSGPDRGEAKSGEKYHFDVPAKQAPSIRLPKQDAQTPVARPGIESERGPDAAPVEADKKKAQKPKEEQRRSIGSPVQPKPRD